MAPPLFADFAPVGKSQNFLNLGYKTQTLVYSSVLFSQAYRKMLNKVVISFGSILSDPIPSSVDSSYSVVFVHFTGYWD